MANAGRQRIFVSYARRDGAELAVRLEQDLTAAGFDVWRDTERIGGGASWTVEIEEAIDRAEVVLAVLTPGSFESEICRAEQLRSLRLTKCVIPVLAGYGAEVVPLHLEGKNWRKYPEQWTELLGDISRRDGAALPERYRETRATYISVPPRVANLIERPEALRALRDTLFAADGDRAVALTALEGMGGIGKTVLAQALFQDEVVRQAFPDGLVWITVGREPTFDWDSKLREVARALGGVGDEVVSAETLYRTTIAGRAALIVIDDIWNKAHLDPFVAESPRSRFLFTTRDASIARFSGAREHRVDLLEAPPARELLARWAGLEVAALPPAAEDILRECRGLPLALSTAGAMLRGKAPVEWADTAGLLRKADLSAIEERLPPGYQGFFRAIEVSVKALPAGMQRQYGRLAVLLEDMPAALPVLQTLWSLDEAEARGIGGRLVDRSLAQYEGESGIRLHDLQLDYLRAQFSDREALELIHGAVRLSAHVIEEYPRQFASQVVGRLLPYGDTRAIRKFIDEIVVGAPVPWLRAQRPALHPPGTALLRTLVGHSGYVYSAAVTPDGKRAVSVSWDKTVKVWDLETGRLLRTLEDHRLAVYGVAVTPDGKRAVSASWDAPLRLWDLDTGQLLRRLSGHSNSVSAVAVTPDGRRAVSASVDRTLKSWYLDTGWPLLTLEGHSGGVCGVAVTPDGKQAVSASDDRTLKVWELDTGRALRTLVGHSDAVLGVAVTPDGTRAVSASRDKTLKVWDLNSGEPLATLEGHSDAVRGVAVTPDGKRAVSASEDKTLRVWDLDAGRALHTLEGHSGAVSGVALTANGRRAVSASWDHTLKMWDLSGGHALPAVASHSAGIAAVAVTPDRRWVVSTSYDKTLKVWEVESGLVVRTLEGHSGPVLGVALTPNGRRAVSASYDKTLRVWDLDTGRTLRILEGHSDFIYAVAVTPDGRSAISGSQDKTLKVWDLSRGSVLRTLEGHAHYVSGVAVTPDGTRAVSASWDKTLKVWELATGRVLRTLEGHSSFVHRVRVTPDGKRVVSASSDNTLKVWELATGRVLRTLEGHSDGIFALSIAPDGRHAVSGAVDHSVMLWDLDTGLRIATFHCEASAGACTFVDQNRIVAGDGGGRLYFLVLEE
jgi:WD40 repeat protein